MAMIGVCAITFTVKQFKLFESDRYVGFVCGLCIVAVTVAPVCKLCQWVLELDGEMIFDSDGGEYEEYSSYFEGYLVESYLSEIKGDIEAYICSEHSLDPDNVAVTIYKNEENEFYIYVNLTGKGVLANTNKMKSQLENKYNCRVQITVG